MYTRVNFDDFAARLNVNADNPTNRTVFDAAALPPDVQRALADPSTDRSAVTFRVLAACHRAGMLFDDARAAVLSRPDLCARVGEKRTDYDLLNSWVKITDTATDDDKFFRIPNNGATQPPPTAKKTAQARDAAKNYLEGAFTAAELQKRTFVTLVQFIAGLVTEGLGIIGGPPKLGKSWWTLSAALAISSGGTAFNAIKLGESRPVLLLALEDSERRLSDRIRALLGDEQWPANLTIKVDLPPGDLKGAIAQFLDANPGGLIILDTLGRCRSPKQRGADVYAEDYAAGVDLKTTVDPYPGAGLLVVHHTRKSGADDYVSELSGSHGLPGAADYVLIMKRPRGSDEAVIHVTGRDVEESEYAFRVSKGCLWQLDGDGLAAARKAAATRREATGVRAGSHGDAILEHLKGYTGDPQTATEIGLATGVGRSAVTVLGRLHEKGLVVRLPGTPARWKLAD